MEKNNRLVSALGVALVCLLLVGKMNCFHYSSGEDFYYGDGPFTIKTTKLDSINIDLNHAQQKADSLSRVKLKYTDNMLGTSGVMGPIGVVQALNYDDLDKHQPYYILLGNIGLTINEHVGESYLVFYTKNGKSYLSKTKLAKVSKLKVISYVDKEVPYRYYSKDKAILVPLHSDFGRFSSYAFWLIYIVLLLATYLFILFTFGNFLLAISKNDVFSEGNIQRLKDMSIAFFILGIQSWVINGIIYLIFCLNNPSDGVIINRSFWDSDYLLMISAIISYLIYTAFKRGMILQQENELTI